MDRKDLERISKDDHLLSLSEPVGEPPGNEFQKTRNALRNPFDEADKDDPCSKHLRQEERKQRIDHFTRGIVEQTDPPQVSDISRKSGKGPKFHSVFPSDTLE